MKVERSRVKGEGWKMKDEGRKMKDEGWKIKDEGWKMKNEGWRGFCRQMDGRTDICDCRIAFATENIW